MKVPGTTSTTPEQKMQRAMLDWIEVVKPESGSVLVARVPDEHFIMPGTPPEDVTEEQVAMMNSLRAMLGALVEGLHASGIKVAGACILADGMTLESVMPPRVVVPDRRVVLPPGTKL